MATTTPDREVKHSEYDTITRSRFFNAFDNREKHQGVASIAHLPQIQVPPSTARYWLKQREKLGEKAIRRTRRNSKKLGRKSKISAADLTPILDPNNPLHEEPYHIQASTIATQPCERTLRYHTSAIGAQRFKKPRITSIRQKNKEKRLLYGQEHQDKTIWDYWQWVYFTDEAHWLSSELRNTKEYELRIAGQDQHYNEDKEDGLKVTLHTAGGISYNHKGPLIFYKDPVEKKTRRAPKPKQLKYETQERFLDRLKVWEDEQAREALKPKGNCMTQRFYNEEVLPHHIKELHYLQERYKRPIYFQEDGDPSHGNSGQKNVCYATKQAASLTIHPHPPQSPDLSPIESIWGLIKQRLRGRSWQTMEQFKAAIQAEWDGITMEQIRRRIREMPDRCRQVQDSKGARIKSQLW